MILETCPDDPFDLRNSTDLNFLLEKNKYVLLIKKYKINLTNTPSDHYYKQKFTFKIHSINDVCGCMWSIYRSHTTFVK